MISLSKEWRSQLLSTKPSLGKTMTVAMPHYTGEHQSCKKHRELPALDLR
jgi:hypothetical protein